MTAAKGDAGGGQIVVVQALRLVAAALVLALHAEVFGYQLALDLGMRLPGGLFLLHGGFGVDLFFAISGFVMVVSTGRGGAVPTRLAFLRRRVVRVAPLYWLATLYMAGWLAWLGRAPTVDAVARSLLFIPYAGPPTNRIAPVLDVGWTLNYEMVFYVLFALALGRDAKATALRAAALLAGLAAIGGLMHLLQMHLPMPAWAWARPILLEFVGGIMVALLWRRGVQLRARWRWALVAGALGLLVLYEAGGVASSLQRTLTAGIAGSLLLAAAVLGPLRLPWNRLWVVGGDISYALYLWHFAVLWAVQSYWKFAGWSFGRWQQVVYATVAVLASVVVAYAVHRWIERPLTAALNRWLAPRSGVAGGG